SLMVNSSQQEPRMCPASCVRTENSGLIVNESERGISLNWFSAACASGVEYKGRGLAWLLYFFFAAYFASSSCRCAESSSNNWQSSRVAASQYIGPRYPAFTIFGR